ncbi:MAG: hypothetical protein ACK55I_05765, partial [bacterium]
IGKGIFFCAALANLRAMPAYELSVLWKRSETMETLTIRSDNEAISFQLKKRLRRFNHLLYSSCVFCIS